MTFKEGDLIRGLPRNGYAITNENMTKGKVLSASRDTMRVRVVEHKYTTEIGCEYTVDNTDSKFAKVGERYQKGYDIRIIRKPGSSDVTASANRCTVTVGQVGGEFDFMANAKLALDRLMEKLAEEEEKAKVPTNSRGVKVGDLVRVECNNAGLEAGDLAEVIGLGFMNCVYAASPKESIYDCGSCFVPGAYKLKQPFTYLSEHEYAVLDRQPVFAKREKSE